MKIFHPEHYTAGSRRTCGMPLIAADTTGKTTDLGGTFKRARMIEIPDSTIFIMHGYSSNSGRRSIHFYKPEDGMPHFASIEEDDGPSSIPDNVAGDALAWAKDFLWS